MLPLITTTIHAANVDPKIDGREVGVVVSDLSLPNTLPQDLASGFENKLLVRVVVLAKSDIVARTNWLITAKYDLWEEKYFVTRHAADGPVDKMSIQTTPEMVAYLSTLTLHGLFKVAALPPEQDLVMRVELFINPIEREKIDRLREWVAANSAPRGVIDSAAYTPKPNDLFNRIFDQYPFSRG